VTLPASVVVVNGSGSYDDLKIVKYLWTRLPTSLAAGKILGTSNTESALLLVNLVPGIYAFQLQVKPIYIVVGRGQMDLILNQSLRGKVLYNTILGTFRNYLNIG